MKRFPLVLALWPLLLVAQPPLGYTISTVAGNGTSGYSGDSGLATGAQLNSPAAVALDAQGNLVLSDQLNSRIRRVTGGNISTIVGSGTHGYSGDAAAATSANITYPRGIAVDGQGNLLFSDSQAHAIRRVTSSGTISTVVGGQFEGFNGDGAAATGASIDTPAGIAIDSAGNYYFADKLNHRIRKVTAAGIISTYAGVGPAGSSGDGGAATAANLNGPEGVALDAAGNLYIADTGNDKIRRVAPDGTITTIAGNGIRAFSGDGGAAIAASLNTPRGVAVGPGGLIFIADSFNDRVRVISANGTISTIAGSGFFGDTGDGGPANAATFRFPIAVVADASGRVYVADSQNHRIRLLTPVPTPGPPPGPPVIGQGGIISAGSFGASSQIAPGSWIEIYGNNLGSSTRQWTAAEFQGRTGPVTLDGTRVSIGGRAAFVALVSPGQLNVQVPSDIPTGPQAITVTTGAGTSAPASVTVNPVQGGLLAPPAFLVGTRQYAVAALTGGARPTYALPVGAVQGVSARPAKPGEVITLYGVGFGPVTPNVLAGEVTAGLNSLTTPLQILFGQTSAQVAYAGLAPGAVGLYQFNVIVPNVPDSDAVQLNITLNGAPLSQTLFTAVRR